MSWNFILLIFINVCQVRWIFFSSLYSRINYVHSPDGELLCGSVGIIKTMHTGFSAYVLHYANAPVYDTEEAGRYDLAWKRFV